MVRVPAGAATVLPLASVAGVVPVPGDKSISHRYALLAALADGRSVIEGFAPGADCAATLACLRALGVDIETPAGARVVIVRGRGVRGLAPPGEPLDAANSGTTLRLLSGIVAAHPFRTVLGGDASLQRRPMRRIIDPLSQMGARIASAPGGRPPLSIDGGALQGILHEPAVPSAQVKSAVLLAGLQASGDTTVREPVPTRDHTERALQAFGAEVRCAGTEVSVAAGQRLRGRALRVPGDISSAAFWAVLAAGTPGGSIEVPGVGLNPTRTGVLAVLERAGARVEVVPGADIARERVGTLRVAAGAFESFEVDPSDVPFVIDEIPALAALAAMMPPGRQFSVRGAAELRVKESDRITALVSGLHAMGAEVIEHEDGFSIRSRVLAGGTVDSAGDHRLAMAFAVAATRARGATTILGASAVDISYPGFFDELERLRSGDHR